MNNKPYDLAVYIGRFQPFHNGHLHALLEAHKLASKVLVLIGTSESPRTPKNPWTFQERASMIMNAVEISNALVGTGDLIPIPRRLNDFMYDDTKWVTRVQQEVDDFIEQNGDLRTGRAPRIVIVGHEKDASSYYLRMFPQWEFVDTGAAQEKPVLEATKIRQLIFEDNLMYVQSVVPPNVYTFLSAWSSTTTYDGVRAEYDHYKEYKAKFASAPFPPTFLTADACVIQSGHVLLVRRKREPGKGLYALPGGFVNQHETMEDAALRELIEETNIKLQPDVLKRCIRYSKVFDAPHRSLRGRTVTQAFLIRLDDSKPLAKVKAGDDAEEAMWVPFNNVMSMRPEMFEDHYDMVFHMISKA
jgi:bifunctional NMN adenylyltransferase/nudix hydrolase